MFFTIWLPRLREGVKEHALPLPAEVSSSRDGVGTQDDSSRPKWCDKSQNLAKVGAAHTGSSQACF